VTRVNDVGGLTGFGAVGPRSGDTPFHANWERHICGLIMGYSAAGRANEAAIRDAVDRMTPAHYLAASPWERWVTGLAAIAVEQGVLTEDDLVERAGGAFPLSNPPESDVGVDIVGSPEVTTPRFASGTMVRVRKWHPHGHTRCPRYAQGCTGVVVRRNGRHALPDLEVSTGEIRAEHTYCVRFAAIELWGEGASPNQSVHLDLYDSYLMEAP
jgi:nitrile hydratase subunit beta